MPAFRLNDLRKDTILVGDTEAIRFLGPDGPRVLSTPRMIGFMERACRDLVLTMLDEGYDTVGTHVNVWHRAAAPMGSTVVITAELLEILSDDGKPRRAEFRVLATMPDGTGGDKIIGEGTHQRGIINVRRFREKVAE